MDERVPPIEELLPADCLASLTDISTRAYGCRILGDSGWPGIEMFLEEQRQALRTYRQDEW
jgi:hypothetical protein